MDKWVIWKGWHACLSNIFQRLCLRVGTKPITYTFLFLKDNWYPYTDEDDLDINKLAGFSYGLHHKNSIRIGWIPSFINQGKFSLCFYIYNNGERYFQAFADINPGTEYKLTISLKDGKVFFELKSEKSNESVIDSVNFVVPKFKLGYYLWFYFGGNKTAPKRMVVFLNKD